VLDEFEIGVSTEVEKGFNSDFRGSLFGIGGGGRGSRHVSVLSLS